MATAKATKKFNKNHLKDTLKRRKDTAKIKQQHQRRAKKKARGAADNGQAVDSRNDDAGQSKVTQNGVDKGTLENMTVDEFFDSGFEAVEALTAHGKQRSGKRKRSGDEDENALVDSVESRVGEDFDDNEDYGEEEDTETHKKTLESLKERDPEFRKFLQEEDPELLDFGYEESDDDLVDTTGTGAQAKENTEQAARQPTDITKAMVQNWTEAMLSSHSLRALREVLLAFRGAANLNDEAGSAQSRYTVSSADAYHELLVTTLNHIPTILQHHLPVKENARTGKSHFQTDSPKFRKLSPLLRSHTSSILKLLDSLSDAATMQTALSSLLQLMPHLLSFKKLLRTTTRSVTDIWSSPGSQESVRISAFLILRRIATVGDGPTRETVLRTCYQGLLRGCRQTNIHTLPSINLMKNSAVDLWDLVASSGKDGASMAYTTSFTFLRTLTLHLRNSVKHPSTDAHRTVYNWQYIHALDLWSRLLSTSCEPLTEATRGHPSPLRPLIYPLVQTILGAARLLPTPAFFPLRFHLIRSLLRLSSQTGTFIPLAAPLYEVLTSSELRKAPKPSTIKPLDFPTTLRAPLSQLRTRVYQDAVGEQVLELLSEFLALWSKNVAFPELALPVIVMLKRWVKEVAPPSSSGNRNNRLTSQTTLLVQKLSSNSRFISERRAKLEFSPRHREGVEGFLKEMAWEETPLGAYVSAQRKVREEQKRMLEAARRAEGSKGSDGRGKPRWNGDSDAEEQEGFAEEMEKDPEMEEEIIDEDD